MKTKLALLTMVVCSSVHAQYSPHYIYDNYGRRIGYFDGYEQVNYGELISAIKDNNSKSEFTSARMMAEYDSQNQFAELQKQTRLLKKIADKQ